MRKYSTEKVEEEVVQYYCDICKEEMDGAFKNLKGREIDWVNARIRWTSGQDYPGCEEYYDYDVCHFCLRDKIVPLIDKHFNLDFFKHHL